MPFLSLQVVLSFLLDLIHVVTRSERDCGRLEEAASSARDAIAHYPRGFYPHSLLGSIHFQLGEAWS